MLTIDALLQEAQVDAARIEALQAQLSRLEPKQIVGAIDSLAEKQRLALALRFYESLTTEEISAVLGSRPETVETLLVRATESLCAKLEAELGIKATRSRAAAAGGATA